MPSASPQQNNRRTAASAASTAEIPINIIWAVFHLEELSVLNKFANSQHSTLFSPKTEQCWTKKLDHSARMVK